MSHHQFGQLVGDEDIGGIVGQFVMLDDYTSVAIETVQQGEALPVVALGMNGRVSRSQDTHGAVYVMSMLDAGALVKFIYDAVERVGTSEAMSDFRVGMATGRPS
jgi:hypothetical protein